jgi:CheY-like chemotaxis protein
MNFPDTNLPHFVIVDDCEDDAFLLRHRLRQGGIANPVTTFESASEALAYLTSLYGINSAPHLLFVDIRMHGGFELIAALREDTRFDEMKIVVVTYSNQPADLKRSLELRVDGYVLKFPDPDILAEFVQHGPWFDVSSRVAAANHALCA